MTEPASPASRHQGPPLRLLAWLAALAVIAAPWLAMRLGIEGVEWTAFDFIFASALLFGALAIYELVQWFVRRPRDRLLIAGALLLVVATIWVDGAVGVF